MKHKFILCLMAAGMLLLGTQPLAIRAAEMQEKEVQTEQVSGDGYEIMEHYDLTINQLRIRITDTKI